MPHAASDGDHADDPLAGRDRDTEVRLGALDLERGPNCRGLLGAADPDRPTGGDDPRGLDVVEDPPLELGLLLALVEPVQEPGMVRLRVVHGDREAGRAERLRSSLADDRHDRVEVELLDEGLADLVDDRQLGIAPAHLGLQRGDARLRGSVRPGCFARRVELPGHGAGRGTIRSASARYMSVSSSSGLRSEKIPSLPSRIRPSEWGSTAATSQSYAARTRSRTF